MEMKNQKNNVNNIENSEAVNAHAKKRFVYFDSILAFLSKNWVTILLVFLSAVILWGLILKNENPDRTKNITDIPVTLEGEADLLSRHLVVVGDRSTIFPTINVGISIDLLRYKELTAQDVTAVASLRQISGEGSYELSVSAVTNKGTVVSVYPKTVTVTVDRLNTKKIPVEVSTENTLKKGLTSGELTATKKEIEIEGANSIISNIVKAVYIVDLSDVRESLNESVSLLLIDENDNPVSQKEIYGEIPSVGISMPVYYYREVGFEIEDNLLNTDLINQNFEIVSMYCEPSNVRILSENEEYVDGIEMLNIEKIDVTGAKYDIVQDVEFTVPDGTWLEKDIKKVVVHIIIKEKQIEKTFSAVKISVLGENKKLQYKYDIASVDVKVKCNISIANVLDREDIKLFINVNDFENGSSYEVPITYEILNTDITDIIVTLSSDSVSFEVTELTE